MTIEHPKTKHPKTSTTSMAKLAWTFLLILQLSSVLMVSLYLMQISNMQNRFKSLQKILGFSILGKFQLLPNKNAQIALSLLVGFGLITLTPLVMIGLVIGMAVDQSEPSPELDASNIEIGTLLKQADFLAKDGVVLFMITGISFALAHVCLGVGYAASVYAFANSNIFTGAACLIFSLLLGSVLSLGRSPKAQQSQERENLLYEYRTSPSCQFDQPTVNYNDNDPIVASA